METRGGIEYLLKAERRYVSFHATLPQAQQAAEEYPEHTDILVQATSGSLQCWSYDWDSKSWEQGAR